MKRMRWGLIGASDIAATRMAPAMRALGHEITAVASGAPEWAQAYALRHEIPHAVTLEEMLGRDDVDAVYVSSVNERHRTHTEAAAAAGKHVLCEKPLAVTAADAEAMIAACDAAGVVLAVNHHLPGAGLHRAVRDLVAGGAVGEPMGVRVFHAGLLPERLRGWRLTDVPGSGVILDLTCHDASVVNPLLGRPALDAVAVAARQGPWQAASEDAVMSSLRYAGDVLVQTHDAFTVAHARTGLEVHGAEGSIIVRDAMTQDPDGVVHLADGNGVREIEVDDRRDLYQILLAGFAGAVAGEGALTVSGRDGLAALRVALAVQEAARTGRRVTVGP